MGKLHGFAEGNRVAIILNWCARHPYRVLAFLTVVSLAPFLAKPFNIDEPLFVWIAQQIQQHPADPYGFNVNWYGMTQPMWEVTQNPPLMSYYLAITAGIFGWSEIGLHIACLLPAVAVILGTFRLAKQFCRWPLFAALATLFAPAFFVSSSTVMCDVALLAFWIWAVVFWTEGLKQNEYGKLSAAGMLAALAVITKYNGICIVPLLAAYGWLERRTIGCWAAFLLIPFIAIFTYEWLTLHLYGRDLLFSAAHYATSAGHGPMRAFTLLSTLAFMGGGFAIALFCSPFLWPGKMLALFGAGAGLLGTWVLLSGKMPTHHEWIAGNAIFYTGLQVLLWSATGVCVIALAPVDIWKNRDNSAWLLALWILGVFVFTAFFNWTVNVRSLLPMAPAVAILIARRLEKHRQTLPQGIKIPIAASAMLSMLLTQVDFQTASAVRKGAEQVCASHASGPGRVWFEGHWGLQYYMELLGAWPLDFNNSELKSGDIFIIPLPEQNANVLPPDAKKVTRLEINTTPVFPWFATMSFPVGAGFYSSAWGPLPFAFGCIPPEKLVVYRFKSSQ